METIERHLDALRRLSREVDDLKNILSRKKIANGVTLDGVTICRGGNEAKLASVDESVVVAGKRLNEM